MRRRLIFAVVLLASAFAWAGVVPHQPSIPVPVAQGGTGTAAFPTCANGQAVGYDGGWGCLSVGGTAMPATWTASAGQTADVSTWKVVGAVYVDPTDFPTQTCVWEAAGSTTAAGATLYAMLIDTADAGMSSTLAITAQASTRSVSGTLTWPAGARLYEVRIALDGGTAGVDIGSLGQAGIRCK